MNGTAQNAVSIFRLETNVYIAIRANHKSLKIFRNDKFDSKLEVNFTFNFLKV